jgi:CheY-like chemotaxis protein
MDVHGVVLLFDHDDDVRARVSTALRRRGYDVMTAPDRATALAYIEHFRPDLLLIGARMATIEGPALVYEQRRRHLPPVPIIVISEHIAGADGPTAAEAIGDVATLLSLDQFLAGPERRAVPPAVGAVNEPEPIRAPQPPGERIREVEARR